jgi:hypothetical protein
MHLRHGWIRTSGVDMHLRRGYAPPAWIRASGGVCEEIRQLASGIGANSTCFVGADSNCIVGTKL